MANWTQTLEEVIFTPCRCMRPFVCDGYPDTCQVLVVGQEPATALPDDWWSFWDPKCGFKETCFESAYLKHRERLQRANVVKKSQSDTRRKFLNRISNNLKPQLKSIETNASMGNDLRRDSNQEVIKVLLEGMNDLRAIIAYGNKAHDLVGCSGKLRPLINLPDDAIREIDHFRKRGRKDADRYEEIDRICAVISTSRFGIPRRSRRIWRCFPLLSRLLREPAVGAVVVAEHRDIPGGGQDGLAAVGARGLDEVVTFVRPFHFTPPPGSCNESLRSRCSSLTGRR